MTPPRVRIVALEAVPLSVPLIEPFVISSGQVVATRAALVTATVEDEAGRRARGLGEAAALPSVTWEDQADLLRALGLGAAAVAAGGGWGWLDAPAAVDGELERVAPASAVARAGATTAVLDAWARLAGVPLALLLGADAAAVPATLRTDITLPISPPAHMAELARGYRARGFDCFKVKIGRDFRADHQALRAVKGAVADARFRLDANAGFSAADALALLDLALGDGLAVECFEQPCAAGDLAGMAEVTARSPVPVVADESFRGPGDLDRIVAAGAARGVNLKLAKLGSPAATLALGREARRRGLSLMAGAMVETRLGIAAMAQVVAALGGVEWVDLDTTFLLARDPFAGGFSSDGGPLLTVAAEPGHGVSLAP